MKDFYLVSLHLFHSEFDRLNLSEEERAEILNIVEEIYLHKLVDRVLRELEEEEEKRIFLKILAAEAQLELTQFLKEKVEDIEEKLREEVKNLTEELILEIKELR